MFFAVVLQYVFQQRLRSGVEEVEGFVEDDDLRILEQGIDDSDFLLVTGREVPDEFLFFQDFRAQEAFIAPDALVDGAPVQSAHAAVELEVFIGSEVVDQETFVHIGSREGFPFFAAGHVGAVHADGSAVGLQEVEHQAEEGGLSGSVVSHQSQDFSFVVAVFRRAAA